jgi:hypothetical protein
MFWSRRRREARRQQVLDELLGLGPNERRGRLELAVARGEVPPQEVEAALALVSRLDTLRVKKVPAGGKQQELPGAVPIDPAAPIPVGPGQARDQVEADETTEESWPSISWLRP